MKAFIYNNGGSQDQGGGDGAFQLAGEGLAAFQQMGADPNFQGRLE
jgi:hypothetical protein